jgi:hypothetical protein
MNRFKVLNFILLIATGAILSACYQQSTGFEYKDSSSTAPDETKSLLPSYSLVSPQVILSNYSSTSGLNLSITTSPEKSSYDDINAKRYDLGDADPSRNILRNAKASAGKYKTLFEDNINACSDSLGGGTRNIPSGNSYSTALQAKQAQNRGRLFPKATSGWSDQSFDTFYLTFLGRTPTVEEASVLLDLTTRVSQTMSHAAVCAVILSSLEALNGT